MSARRSPALEQIIAGLPKLEGQSLLSVSDIAWKVGVAESTLRRHLPALIRDDYIRHTSYVRYYAIGPKVAT